MMKNYKINFFTTLLGFIGLCAMTVCSCENFVEADQPSSQLSGTAVFEDATSARAALANIYAELRNDVLVTGGLTGISVLAGAYSDELVDYRGSQFYIEDFYNNALTANNSVVTALWDDSYNLVYAANAVMERVEASTALSDEEKRRFVGEALFLRAFIQFYQVNLYGAVPYVTSTDYKKNQSLSRMPVKSVYEFIIKDLSEAKTLLPTGDDTSERVLPNKWVAGALLARVYLYNGQWEDAISESNNILGNTPYLSWETDLDKVFLKESTTTLWRFKPELDGMNTEEGESFIFNSLPPSPVALSGELVSAFEEGDLRRQLWIGSVSDESTTYYFPFKYKQNGPTGSSVEYSVLFRMAELYLIRAEAQTRIGDLYQANNDLNRIRQRANLALLDIQDQEALLQAVYKERRHELFTELGHRFFDLKRNGSIDQVLSLVKSGWDSSDVFFPVPEQELLANPNLEPQNPGY